VNKMSEKIKTVIYVLVIVIVLVAVGLLTFGKSGDADKETTSVTVTDEVTTESSTETTTEENTENNTDITTEYITDTTTEDVTTEDEKETTTAESTTIDKNNEASLELEAHTEALLKEYALDVNNIDGIKRICIDPGHQGKGNNLLEPVGPGATSTKKRVSYGTAGISTRIAEYELNLQVSLMLKGELQNRGYEVVMVRETHKVNISNAQRAIFGNNSGADVAVRIHANGSNDSSVNGALTIYPTKKNKYIPDAAAISAMSKELSEKILNSLCEITGAANKGIRGSDSYTGSNWSKIPVTIVEMGYMSNPEEDELLATEEYRKKIVQGIADGIDGYFANVTEY